ncbi:MAG TPA: PAS domain S-box protein, partial [Mariprofundaceae bacterium]|nr:PAS domain S-box protein [Mariprofundaceae bacterium]
SKEESSVIVVSDNFEQMVGMPAHEMINRNMHELFPKEFADKIVADDWEVVSKNRVVQLEEELNGRVYSTTKFAITMDGKALVAGYTIDITQQKADAYLLAESEEKYRTLFENMHNGFALHEIVCDKHGAPIDYIFLEVNPSFEKMTGLKRDQVVGKPVTQVIPGIDKDPANWIDIYGNVALTGKETAFEQYSEGLGRWYAVSAFSPKPMKFATVIEDITDRKKAAEALRASERSLRQAQATGHLGNWLFDKGEEMSWSDECYRIFDVSPQLEITRKHFNKLIHPEDRPAVQAWMERAINAGEPGALVFRHIREDGSIKHINGEVELICDEQGEADHLEGTFQDITERMLLEEQFHQAQKMEALGTLVGGIAHDFNNILAGMTGNIYLAKQQTKLIPGVTEKLETTEKLAFRAAGLISQLLTYARKDRVRVKPIPFVQFVKETAKFLHSTIPESIDFDVVVGSDSVIVMGDTTQLHQVLMNLINNARDAVASQEHPFIKVSLKTVQVDDQFLKNHPEAKAGLYVDLSVEDNGCGIPASDLEHVFDPFFTTKEVGKGTGLGLSMVFGAVQRHQGVAEVDSVEGEGSRFHVYLPIGQLDDVVEPLSSEDSIVQSEGETILLVDDEKGVTDSSMEVLKSLGYRVMIAHDGKEAVDIYSEHSSEIDVVIMDVVMPKMSGVEAAKRIQEIDPNAKIIFMTGYDKTHALPDGLESGGDDLLSKPVNIELLSSVLRKKIDS